MSLAWQRSAVGTLIPLGLRRYKQRAASVAAAHHGVVLAPRSMRDDDAHRIRAVLRRDGCPLAVAVARR